MWSSEVFEIMLRKRSRSIEKDQQMGHLKMAFPGVESSFSSENHKNNSFFNVPGGLFVGLSPKGLSESDSVRSPTSPLDYRVFSNLGNPLRSPRSPTNQKTWGTTSKVGLSIIDSLKDDDSANDGKVLRSESKNILFGPRVRTKTPLGRNQTNSFETPKSLPKNYAIFPYTLNKSSLQKGSSDVVFEIGETQLGPEPFGKIRSRSLDSCRSFSALAGSAFAAHSLNSSYKDSGFENYVFPISPSPQVIGGNGNSNNFDPMKLYSTSVPVGSGNAFPEALTVAVDSLSASEIELSEEYTRVICHGPNPKTTHIYGDCILDCCTNDLSSFEKNVTKELPGITTSSTTMPYMCDDFLSFCYTCNKKLEGKDIYIYR